MHHAQPRSTPPRARALVLLILIVLVIVIVLVLVLVTRLRPIAASVERRMRSSLLRGRFAGGHPWGDAAARCARLALPQATLLQAVGLRECYPERIRVALRQVVR